ncbi:MULTISPECIES: hypothetical protein [Helicobacter]|uniref:hypothetical protein n=1 Tax=Helicobacter TaxID=209 RepID=UPI001F0A96C1|nr:MULTISPECIES: hypothetical protein [Helicobacter]
MGCLPLLGAEIVMDPFGYLGMIYNQGFEHRPHSYVGFDARVGTNFSFNNGWAFGIGAIGAWNVYSRNKRFQPIVSVGNVLGSVESNMRPYLSMGDISDAYVKFDTQRLKFAMGRFNTNFVDFDWIQGNIQGGSLFIHRNDFKYWGIFMDSMLYNGYQGNDLQGPRIATSINALASYDPVSKKKYVGGEVVAFGMDYNNDKGVQISPFLLADTKLPGPALGSLFQLGFKVQYQRDLPKNFKSYTIVHGIYQYGATGGIKQEAQGGLFWIDQTFVYKIFNFGLGFYGVPASGQRGFFWSFDDKSKFYGRGINSVGVPAIYFANDTYTGYLFGGMKTSKVRVDLMLAYGIYQEYSLMTNYKVWQYKKMILDAGIGYVYSYSSKVVSNIGNSSLVLFTKFSY